MQRYVGASAVVAALLIAAPPALSQTRGGTLKIGHFASPASMSMLE